MGAAADQRGRPWRPGQSGNPEGRRPSVAKGLRAQLLAGARKGLDRLEEIATKAMAKGDASDGKDAAACYAVAREAQEAALAWRIGKPWDGRPEDLDRQEEAGTDAGVSLLATVTALGAEEPTPAPPREGADS